MYSSIFLATFLLSGTTAESETTAEPYKCKDEVTNCEEVLDKMRCYEYGDQCPKVIVSKMSIFPAMHKKAVCSYLISNNWDTLLRIIQGIFEGLKWKNWLIRAQNQFHVI